MAKQNNTSEQSLTKKCKFEIGVLAFADNKNEF